MERGDWLGYVLIALVAGIALVAFFAPTVPRETTYSRVQNIQSDLREINERLDRIEKSIGVKP